MRAIVIAALTLSAFAATAAEPRPNPSHRVYVVWFEPTKSGGVVVKDDYSAQPVIAGLNDTPPPRFDEVKQKVAEEAESLTKNRKMNGVLHLSGGAGVGLALPDYLRQLGSHAPKEAVPSVTVLFVLEPPLYAITVPAPLPGDIAMHEVWALNSLPMQGNPEVVTSVMVGVSPSVEWLPPRLSSRLDKFKVKPCTTMVLIGGGTMQTGAEWKPEQCPKEYVSTAGSMRQVAPADPAAVMPALLKR